MPSKFENYRSSEELTLLRSYAHSHQDSRIADRARIVLAYFGGHSIGTLCSLFQISRNVPVFWIKRFNREGYTGLFDRHRSGRPPHLQKKR